MDVVAPQHGITSSARINFAPRYRLAGLARLLRNTLAVFGGLSIVYYAVFDVSPVISPSMSPTLRGDVLHHIPGDWVLSERVTYLFRQPRRWEVVRFIGTDGTWVIKRVGALPGERISIQDHQLWVNGTPATCPPPLTGQIYHAYGNARGGATVACGNGYYVLGDDSKDSQDSRFEGPLDPARLRGRAWLRVWPPSRIGWVNP